MDRLTPEMLDRPRTVAGLSAASGLSASSVRRWLRTFGNQLSIGYTQPRTYWLHEQELLRRRAECSDTTATISSRNAMDSHPGAQWI